MAASVAACPEQPAVPRLDDRQRTAIEDSVRRLAAQFIAADSDRDPDRAIALFADEPDVTIVSNGVMRPSRAAFAQALRDLYRETQTLEIELEDDRVSVLSADAAVLVARYRSRRTDRSGRVLAGRAVLTYVCARRGGAWRILHYHFSRVADPS